MIRTLAPFDPRSFSASVDEELTLDDDRAHALVGMQLAIYIDSDAPVREILNAEQPVTGVGENSGTEYEFGKPEETPELKRPYGNATKAQWVEYALSVDPDLTEEAAGDMSKVSLMTAYGERLLQSFPDAFVAATLRE